MKRIIHFLVLVVYMNVAKAQQTVISGKLKEKLTGKAIAGATIHLQGTSINKLSKADGSFTIITNKWCDTLEITSIGYEVLHIPLQKNNTTELLIELEIKASTLKEIAVKLSAKPAKTLMQQVIEHKKENNPSTVAAYTARKYCRNELDIDNMDFASAGNRGLKNIMLKAYADIDSNAASGKELPVYFDEIVSGLYHLSSPAVNRESIIAKRNLGLRTDKLLGRLDKFGFEFNVYDNWLPVFNKTFASPLNDHAFNYYSFSEEAVTLDGEDSVVQVRFTPRKTSERTFTGTLWINKTTWAVETVDLHLGKTADVNYIRDIYYRQDYQAVYDSSRGMLVQLPAKYISEVRFESGWDLLGIPVPENKNSLKLMYRNTTVLDQVKLDASENAFSFNQLHAADSSQSDNYWNTIRSDSLTAHEKNIYLMVASLKQNRRFQRGVKLTAFAASGYWDFANNLRIGPYSSFISHNPIEGWRFRTGWWTLEGVSRSNNLYGYAAYGTKDKKLKGLIGFKHLWNYNKWSKTTLSWGSDYDFIIDQDDELDKDNLISSFFRKPVPFSRVYVNQGMLKHEQYLSNSWSAKTFLTYKTYNPVFDFKYRPINPAQDKPFDSIYTKKLPVAEAGIVFRYAPHEKTKVLNYDKIQTSDYSPIFTVGYTTGFEAGKAMFHYQKLSASIEQQLRLPPKALLYYKIESGKIWGTVPYLLLHIPAGSEYYVSSRYQFNTMIPYEFVSDRYIELHSRLQTGGLLLNQIPFIKKLGWRERASFNAYWGDMSAQNKMYNEGSHLKMTGRKPFMEAGVGIENIFHVLSIEYFRRLNYNHNPLVSKDGIYLGVTLFF